MDDDGLAGVPEAYRDAAEQVRDHLVFLRGGGIFVSSNDAVRLVRWLDEGVPVRSILLALERAADFRRRKRSRIPLSLGAATRHLGQPTSGALVDLAVDTPLRHPLAPLCDLVRTKARDDTARASLERLADALEALGALAETPPTGAGGAPNAPIEGAPIEGGPERPDRQDGGAAPGEPSPGIADRAIARIRSFFVETWAATPPAELAALRQLARESLGDLATLVDERVLAQLIEEYARDLHRQRYAWLTAATVCDLLGHGEAS